MDLELRVPATTRNRTTGSKRTAGKDDESSAVDKTGLQRQTKEI
jgi:hypothetical protein